MNGYYPCVGVVLVTVVLRVVGVVLVVVAGCVLSILCVRIISCAFCSVCFIVRFLGGSFVFVGIWRVRCRVRCCVCCWCCCVDVVVVLIVVLCLFLLSSLFGWRFVSVVVACFVVANLCKKWCRWCQAAGSQAGPKKAKVGWLIVCWNSLRKL